jgi:hypothetical protein
MSRQKRYISTNLQYLSTGIRNNVNSKIMCSIYAVNLVMHAKEPKIQNFNEIFHLKKILKILVINNRYKIAKKHI